MLICGILTVALIFRSTTILTSTAALHKSRTISNCKQPHTKPKEGLKQRSRIKQGCVNIQTSVVYSRWPWAADKDYSPDHLATLWLWSSACHTGTASLNIDYCRLSCVLEAAQKTNHSNTVQSKIPLSNMRHYSGWCMPRKASTCWLLSGCVYV